MKKRIRYRLLFTVFNIIGAVAALAIAIFLLYELSIILFKTESEEDKILKVNNLDSNPENAPEISEEPTNDAQAIIGNAPHAVPPKPFDWGKDEELILEAMHLFSQKSNWEACLYLASIQNEKKLDMQEVEQFTENYYQRVIIKGLMKEFEKSGWEWKPQYQNFDDLFNDLGLTYSLTMINNLRVYMEKDQAIPKAITTIMIKVFLNSINNPFLKIVSFDMLAQEKAEDIDYLDAKAFAHKCLSRQDKLYLEMYMQQCVNELWRHWFQADKGLQKWIIDIPANRDELHNLTQAVEGKDDHLSEREFRSFSSLHRQIIANYAIKSIKDRSQSKFFENFAYWNEDIKREASKLNRNNIQFFRKNYRWIVLLNNQDYEKAFNTLKVCYKAMTGFNMPPDMEKRIWAVAHAEKELWDDIVSQTAWKQLVQNATRGKKKLSRKLFWRCLYDLFPANSRTEKQKVLIALCMINRGFNPQVFVNLKINYNLLKKYVPEEELNGQQNL